MSTTSVIIEHFLAGVLACLAGVLWVLGFWGYEWIPWAVLQDFKEFFAVSGLAVAYPLGICVDQLSDDVAGLIRRVWGKIRGRSEKPGKPTVSAFELLVKSDGEFLREYLDYTRSRLRMTRSMALTLPFCTVGLAVLMYRHLPLAPPGAMLGTVLGGGALSLLSLWSAWRISATFTRQRDRAAEILSAPK